MSDKSCREGLEEINRRLECEIRERKAVEAGLRESGQNLEAFLNAIPESAFLIDANGIALLANLTAAKRRDRSVEELIGASIYDYISPDVAEVRREKVCEVVRTGKPANFIDQRDGRYVNNNIYPIVNDKGEVTRLAVVGMDVTEIHDANQALLRNEAFFNTVFDSIQDGICVLNTDMFIIRCNTAMEKLHPHRIPLVGKKCHEAYYGRSEPCRICPVGQAFETGTIQKEEVPLILEQKEIGLLEVYVFPILDESGKPSGVVECFRDITHRKSVEEMQKALLSELERTNNELKDFAYIVSHDLKAPLRGIHTIAKWLQEDYAGVLDEQGNTYLNKLMSRTQRMHFLIDRILQYSRVGRMTPEPVMSDSDAIVREIMDTIVLPEGFAISVENKLPVVLYDETHLKQVFQNLIENAIKHHGKKQGKVSVSFEDTGDFFEFRVRDDGVGIEEKHFDKIFKMFQTLKAKSEDDSTGIGLALVKRIVHRHGGSVWVESSAGNGSAFVFTIPKSDA